MTLNERYDKIYCINLDSRPDKWDRCLEQFNKLNIKVERYPAINGKEIIDDFRKNILLDGEIGILLTHIEILKKAKEEKLNNIFIFEDDVEFDENFITLFDDYSKQIPDNTQLFYLGGNHIGMITPISSNIFKLHHSYAIHAIGIDNGLYDNIITGLENYTKAVDVYYADLQKFCNAYVVKPHLCWQRPGISDIQGGFVNYEFLK